MDCAAPEGTPRNDLLTWAHDAILAQSRTPWGFRTPLVVASGPWIMRFQFERALEPDWHDRLHELMGRLMALP